MVTVLDRLRQTDPQKIDGLAARAQEFADKKYDLSGDNKTPMCMLAFNTPCQEPDGAIRLCSASSTFGFANETNMGDARTHGLAAVWRGEKYRHIRKTLFSGEQLEPYCASCEYRFHGPAWMFQLHLALFAYEAGAHDEEVLGLIRRWRHRYDEYHAQALSLGLGTLPLPDVPDPAPGQPEFNQDIPHAIVDGKDLPVYIDFNTLNRCNVSCIMCPPALQHDDHGIPRDEYYRLTKEEFTSICEGLNVKTAHFVGAYAEPLLNKDIFELIKMAHDAGAFTAITTNATPLVPPFAAKLLDAGLDMMTISLHGATAETAEAIMRKASFKRVTENIRYLQALKKERGLAKPDIYFNFVSQRANVEEIPDFISLAADLGVQHVHVIHLIDGGLDDKSTNLIHYPELLGPAIVAAKQRATDLGVHAYISPAYSEIVANYEASLNT